MAIFRDKKASLGSAETASFNSKGQNLRGQRGFARNLRSSDAFFLLSAVKHGNYEAVNAARELRIYLLGAGKVDPEASKVLYAYTLRSYE